MYLYTLSFLKLFLETFEGSELLETFVEILHYLT